MDINSTRRPDDIGRRLAQFGSTKIRDPQQVEAAESETQDVQPAAARTDGYCESAAPEMPDVRRRLSNVREQGPASFRRQHEARASGDLVTPHSERSQSLLAAVTDDGTPDVANLVGVPAGLQSGQGSTLLRPQEARAERAASFSGLQCTSIPPFGAEKLEKLAEDYGWPFERLSSPLAANDRKYDQLLADITSQKQNTIDAVISMFTGYADNKYPKDFHDVNWPGLDTADVIRQMRDDYLQANGLFDRWNEILREHGGFPPEGTPADCELREAIGLMMAYSDRLGDGLSELHRRGLIH